MFAHWYVTAHRDPGNVPLIWTFLPKLNEVIRLSIPSSLGSVPVKAFSEASSSTNEVKLPSSDGTTPEKSFPAITSAAVIVMEAAKLSSEQDITGEQPDR
jgi:hypothetical protein